MNDKQIFDMVSDLVEEVDYDYWKEIFLNGYENPEDQKQRQDSLVKIARTHING